MARNDAPSQQATHYSMLTSLQPQKPLHFSMPTQMALLQLQPLFTPTFPSQFDKLPRKSRITLSSNPRHHRLNKSYHRLQAVAEEISAAAGDQSVIQEDEVVGQKDLARYDWTEEWYPLYLTNNVPDDAPLGLTVFDKQVVLFKDGGGVIRCYEDRCPHR